MFKIFLFCSLWLAEAHLNDRLSSISITRRHKGDVYIAQGEKCFENSCVSLTSKTGEPNGDGECECKCEASRPVFRDDLNICVDDIQECSLLSFASGASVKKIPYVFLPLKGQIVYPSAEIVISDAEMPVCVVSGGQFLGRTGWLDLRNHSGTEPPFRLFRDEGKTYLQWLGETPLRMAMEGRIILVHLMCKDASYLEEPKIFTPCLAFRVAGNPSVREVMFATDVHLKGDYNGGLSLREYVAIGICSLLLAVVYVASIFLYLHWRRRKRKQNRKSEEDTQLTLGEEGVIKSNPLLQANRLIMGSGEDNAGYISDSNSCTSDADRCSDLLCLDDESVGDHQNVQTSALIHPCASECGEAMLYQDANSIEKLPEENVSIVETLEVKDDFSETVKAMGANGRRKLYFNPSYFEPDLLKAPPPAALEFLIKIREVIAIAKHKMSAKKFSPSLLGIPEEDGSQKADNKSTLSRSENKRRSLQTESIEEEKSLQAIKEEKSISSHFPPKEFCCPMDAKQKIIRKWLEDVPIMMHSGKQRNNSIVGQNQSKPSIWPDVEEPDSVVRNKEGASVKQERKRPSTKGKAPPPPPRLPTEKKEAVADFSSCSLTSGQTKIATPFTLSQKKVEKVMPPSPPPLPFFNKDLNEAPRVQVKDRVTPTIAKNLMDAVIQELTGFRKQEKFLKPKDKEVTENPEGKKENGSEIEKLEVQTIEKLNNNIQPKDKTHNDTTNLETINKAETGSIDDHEYEVILLNADQNFLQKEKPKDLKIYNLPEILSKNERNEGYSLVSEVYVNDGYSCCSGESPPSSFLSIESEKIRYPMPHEKPGRLTIHVNDSPEQYNDAGGETDNFEPDTLDRKPQKLKKKNKIYDRNREKYSNQRFHDMERQASSNGTEQMNNENFTDSLERPSIMLKTSGSFNRSSVERNIDNLLRNFTWSKVENFGSLREIYEAKSKSHKRTETTSLTDYANSDTDRISTLSWSEERRNKLLHRGIVLHLNEDEVRKHHKNGAVNCKSHATKTNSFDKAPTRPPKPRTNPRSRSRSQSPQVRPTHLPLSSKSNCSPTLVHSPRNISPPLPPPRSIPVPSSSTGHGSANSSPTTPSIMNHKNVCVMPNTPSPRDSPIRGSFKNFLDSATSPSFVPQTTFNDAPSRPPKESINNPPLPPRNIKPPLPPKATKSTKQKPGKFASRPLPPLPFLRPAKEPCSSSPVSGKDVETTSTISGGSLDSLNSSEYEAFYTLPYEEEEDENAVKVTLEDSKSNSLGNIGLSISSNSRQFSNQSRNQRWQESERRWQSSEGATPRVEDSGYLSTDSGDSSCPTQMILSPSFSGIPEKIEPNGSQNSETEESICDGASESGAESTTTDSFFYGDFKITKVEKSGEGNITPDVFPYSLRLSDVEVNSDTERHCVPIMVRP